MYKIRIIESFFLKYISILLSQPFFVRAEKFGRMYLVALYCEGSFGIFDKNWRQIVVRHLVPLTKMCSL